MEPKRHKEELGCKRRGTVENQIGRPLGRRLLWLRVRNVCLVQGDELTGKPHDYLYVEMSVQDLAK